MTKRADLLTGDILGTCYKSTPPAVTHKLNASRTHVDTDMFSLLWYVKLAFQSHPLKACVMCNTSHNRVDVAGLTTDSTKQTSRRDVFLYHWEQSQNSHERRKRYLQTFLTDNNGEKGRYFQPYSSVYGTYVPRNCLYTPQARTAAETSIGQSEISLQFPKYGNCTLK
jgi:hypothetical protein